MKEKIEHKLSTNELQSLFKGKKLILDYHGFPQVHIYPPQYGVFLSYEEYEHLVRQLSPEERAKLLFITNPPPQS